LPLLKFQPSYIIYIYLYWQGSISLSQNHGESTTYSLTILWLPKLPSRTRAGLWVGLWGRFGPGLSNNSAMLQHARKGFRTLNMELVLAECFRVSPISVGQTTGSPRESNT